MSADFYATLSRELVDKGLVIEAGWQALKATSVPANAPPVQIAEMRNAFFAGAQHLFASIMGILEDGHEATDADLNRMTQISNELDAFVAEYRRQHHLHDH